MSQTHPLFLRGQIVATPGAVAALEQAGQFVHEFLTQHAHGQWGELSAEDWQEITTPCSVHYGCSPSTDCGAGRRCG
jgi:hypothetical protein